MNRFKLRSIQTVACLILLAFNAAAQQPSSVKTKTPRLTSDDVSRTRSRTSGTVVVSAAVDPNKWTKYTPGGLRMAIELPGGLNPLELPVPDYLMNELHREYRDAKFFFSSTSTLSTSMLYLPSNNQSVSPADLKNKANQFVKVVSIALDPKAKYRAEPTDKSTVSLRASYTVGAESFEMVGSMQSRGRDIWLVEATYRPSDETARAAARRIVDSVTMY